MGKKWIPLESNPDVLNEYAHKLGVTGNFEFVDVYGLDEARTMARLPAGAGGSQSAPATLFPAAAPLRVFWLKMSRSGFCCVFLMMHWPTGFSILFFCGRVRGV